MSCLFCNIIAKKVPANIVYEDQEIIAFNDAYPKAPTHILILPKKHIDSVNEIVGADQILIGRLIYQAKLIAQAQGVAAGGYRLIFNCGKNGGQVIYHLHLHLLGGKELEG